MRFLSVIGDPPSAACPHNTHRRGERVVARFHQSDAVATIAAVTTTAARPVAPRLWLEALYTIPRVDLAQVDPIPRWLILSRASVVVMTATSAVIGGRLALRDDVFDAPLLVLTALWLVLERARF